jgi:hypothetical protein
LTLQVTQDNYLELGGAGAAVPYRRKISPVKPGQWVDYVVHVKFSEDPNVGYAEVYENGKLVVEKHYRPTLVAGGGGAYYKQGVYRDVESTGTQVVWHDGLVIYEGVAPPTTLALTQSPSPVARTQTLVADAAVADAAVADNGIVTADTAVAQADEIDGQVPADRGTTASTDSQETTSALDARSAAREERREAREERREAREERREARAAEREARAAERAARQEERAARIAERAARAADQTADAESAEPAP